MTIGIIGAGAMGAGIAQIAAQAGHEVLLYDTKEVALELAAQKMVKVFNRLVEKGRMTSDQPQVVLDRINYVANLKKFEHCGMVIEAIVENLEAKKSVFEMLEEVVHEDCILATNTSSLSIASISSAVKRPARVIGIHFFNPVPLMPLVEITPSLLTNPEVTKEARTVIENWGKVTVLAKDTPGFIVNKVARPFYSEAIKVAEEGLADYATIDWALKTVGGFKMGAFELMDLIGHDVNYVVTETVWTQFYYDPRFKPSITQKRLLEAGQLGRKTEMGFYNYAESAEKPEPNKDVELANRIVNRIVAMLINEAADALFLNIATAQDIDLAMTKGVNYPKGLLAWADEIGIHKIVKRLNKLQKEYGDDRYRACPLLKKMAKQKTTFFS